MPRKLSGIAVQRTQKRNRNISRKDAEHAKLGIDFFLFAYFAVSKSPNPSLFTCYKNPQSERAVRGGWTLSILACYSQMTIAPALKCRGALVECF
jgi:hypothetical protein